MDKLTLDDRGGFLITTESGSQYAITIDDKSAVGLRLPKSNLPSPSLSNDILFVGNEQMLFDVLTIQCEAGRPMYLDITNDIKFGLSWLLSTPVVSIEKVM
jgi:hypothetical protein